MLTTSPLRVVMRTLPLTFAALSLACSDDPTPLAPPAPTRPSALLASVVTVMNTDDAGPGSLRQAIADAPDGTTIQFDPAIAGMSIGLSTGQLEIDKALTIEAPLSTGMTVSGGLRSRVFMIGEAGNVVLRNLSITDGRADNAGGIYNSGKLTLDHSLVANNEAIGTNAHGGGIWTPIKTTPPELVLVNTTVSGNFASGSGGGINTTGPTVLRNSTVTGNASGQGGGITVFGIVSMRNSIVANNELTDEPGALGEDCYLALKAITEYLGLNLQSTNTCGTDSGLLTTNPMLGPLTNNGGPTKTHALLVGSPAIDAGLQCSEATDQRYVGRDQGTSCDVGAFEFNDYARITLVAGPNAVVNAKTGVMTLGGTISCTSAGTVALDVAVSQTQKTTGKFTAIIQASSSTTAYCNGTSSWSVTLAPQTGRYQNGSATATVKTTTVPAGFLSSSIASPIKVFPVK